LPNDNNAIKILRKYYFIFSSNNTVFLIEIIFLVYGLPEKNENGQISCLEKEEEKEYRQDLIKDIRVKELLNNVEILNSGDRIEISSDDEYKDIEAKELEPITRVKITKPHLCDKEKTRISSFFEQEDLTKRFQKPTHGGYGDTYEENIEDNDKYEEIEEKKEILPLINNLKHEKVLKQSPNKLIIENDDGKTVQVGNLENSKELGQSDKQSVQKLNLTNANDGDSYDKSETKAIKIICRTDDILTVFLDRKKNIKKSDSQISTTFSQRNLKKKFSLFSKSFKNYTNQERE
jgi:hypothetical protein